MMEMMRVKARQASASRPHPPAWGTVRHPSAPWAITSLPLSPARPSAAIATPGILFLTCRDRMEITTMMSRY